MGTPETDQRWSDAVFERLVVPLLVGLAGGEIRAGGSGRDVHDGVDYMVLDARGVPVKHLGVRVQQQHLYHTFTIRDRRPSGRATERDKTLSDRLNVHAYVTTTDPKTSEMLGVGIALFSDILALADQAPTKQNYDGSSSFFMVGWPTCIGSAYPRLNAQSWYWFAREHPHPERVGEVLEPQRWHIFGAAEDACPW